MKGRLKYAFTIALVVLCSGVFSQGKNKTLGLFEYQAAVYDAVSNEVTITMKNEAGQSRQFLYSPGDQSQAETILFNPIESLQGNSNVLTKPELIGVKYTISYSYTGSAQEGATCCYKITSCTPE